MKSIWHRSNRCWRNTLSTLLFLALSTAATIATAQTLDRQVEFNIPPQPLASAIIEFSKQADLQLLASSEKLAGIKTVGVKGRHTIEQGLRALLTGTGFTYKLAGEGTVTLVAGEVSAAGSDQSAPPETANGKEEQNTPATKLEAIAVTGTHIRGVSPASPVITVDREDIDNSGYTAAGDVIRSLPQNYNGGNNPQVNTGSQPTSNVSVTGGSSPNLRGIGPASTLTLINGHRLAQDNLAGAGDISFIPIDAIQRVEVIADGASAAYGSDAVAGVVNFILRKNYDGAQANLSYGSATDGGGTEKRESLLLGKTWQGGNALLAYEHDDQQAVDVSQRSFTSTVVSPYSLLPKVSRDSFFVSANQEISPGLSAFFDGLYTSRTTTYLQSLPASYGLPPEMNPSDVEQFLTNGGITIDLANKWKATFVASDAQERALTLSYNVLDTGNMLTFSQFYRTATNSAEIDAEGPLGSLNGNTVRAALGAGTRYETLNWIDNIAGATLTSGNRDVRYAFGELNVPIIAGTGSTGLNRLTLNASGRYDDYSDFGGKFVPKLGVVYGPTDSVSIHASWGKSYSAPQLDALNTPRSVYLFPLANPNSPSGTSLVLYPAGGNRNLLPQTATTWSAGVDYDPDWAPGLHLTTTYFSIDYTNLVEAYNTPSLTDPHYSSLVTLNPSAATQAAIIASAVGGFNNYSGAAYNPATVTAIIDGTERNIAQLKAYGVDVGGAYKLPVPVGELKLFLNGTYLTLVQQITPNATPANIAGVAFNPPRIRARGGETWVTGPWSSTVTLNWLGSSTNTYVSPFANVSSWTTVDAQIAYSPKLSGFLSGVRISLSAQNILNRNPPYLTYDGNTTTGVHFDSTNASPLGRYVTLQLRKSW